MSVSPPRPDQVERILVVQTAGIGDALLTTPAIDALAEHFAPERLDTLSKPSSQEIFERHSAVNEARALERTVAGTWRAVRETRRLAYDLLIDFHCKARTAWLAFAGGIPHRFSFRPDRIGLRARLYNLHGVETSGYSGAGRLGMIQCLGVGTVDPTPRFEPDAEGRAQAAAALPGDGKVIVLSPGTVFESKTWPRHHWIGLAHELVKSLGARVVAVLPPGDAQGVASMGAESNGALSVLPSGSLSFFAALLARSDLLIADCSSARHLAASQGTPTLTLHGGTDPSNWTHPDPMHDVVGTDIECRPCRKLTCNRGGVPCMAELSVEQVLGAARAHHRRNSNSLQRG